jgi:hypothetical protein
MTWENWWGMGRRRIMGLEFRRRHASVIRRGREEGGGREQQWMIRYLVRSRCDANTGISSDFDTLSAARGLDAGNGWMMLFALCSLLFALCSLLFALCSLLFALCSLLLAIGYWLLARHSSLAILLTSHMADGRYSV